MAADARRRFRLGLIRQRQIAFGTFVPVLVVGVAVSAGAPWWLLLAGVLVAAPLAAMAYRTGMSVDSDRLLVHRMFSTLSVAVADIEQVSFPERGNPHVRQPLILRTTGGRDIKVRAVSITRRLLKMPADGRSRDERRVDGFLQAGGLPPLTTDR